MTSKDELREKVEAAIKDGLSNHTGEWFNSWIVPGLNLTEEQLRDLLFYLTKAKRLQDNILNLLEGEKQKVRIDEQYAYDRQLVKCPFRYNDRDELAEFRLVLVDERFAPKPDDKLKQIEVDLTNTLEQFLQQPGGHSSPSSPRIAAEYFITRINDYIATLNKEPNKGEDVDE